jgi:hypothetical protein
MIATANFETPISRAERADRIQATRLHSDAVNALVGLFEMLDKLAEYPEYDVGHIAAWLSPAMQQMSDCFVQASTPISE